VTDLLNALENWVENDVAPDYVVAFTTDNTRSRKVCAYPDEARYRGTGSTDNQSSFRCHRNNEEPAELKADSLTAERYHEAP
jgi:hypothetical protein